ncbi:MAG: ABC transporter ATP-binding protein, partial [SAR202 cluster bacterium]|nr:ABC transporter ATP-binding protein [SAR202 cluster bacterium]
MTTAHTTPQQPHVFCEDLFKIYKVANLEVVALRGLDLKVDRGEVVAIVGASGSGKSTLLSILAGYDSPSAGRITVGDKDLLRMTIKEMEEYRRSEVGFIWQQTSRNLFPYLTALENVELPMMLTDHAGARRRRASELLDIVGLTHRANHTHEKLSGGEQQRVAIAVALANNPPLLLADEPTGELDDSTASAILDLFDSINKEMKTTILIVTHDPQIAYKVGRVVLIRDGKMATEVRRKVTFQGISSKAQTGV